jgi:hypothetical protein
MYVMLALAVGYYIGCEHGENLERSRNIQRRLKERTWSN